MTTTLYATHGFNMSKSPITCHVLDSTLGKPAANVRVQLEALSPLNSQFHILATGATNSDGRCPDLMGGQNAHEVLAPKGIYKMTFFTGEYFDKAKRPTFYPQVEILFQLSESPDAHYHIPLLLSPFSYTTYRGS